MERDFEIGGREFKLNKLDAFKQFHIGRRMGPMLSELLPFMKDAGSIKSPEKMSEDEKLDSLAKLAGPIMSGLSKLSDADADLVLYGLLSSVEIKQVGGNWARIATGSLLMIQDLDLATLLNAAGRAFVFNLGNFMPALPAK